MVEDPTMAKLKPQDTVRPVFEILSHEFPSSRTELTYEGPFQLLVAVILSAQCTDARVNQTTPVLFKKYPTAEKLSQAPRADVEKIIHSCGFFRAKAKAITEMSGDLLARFGGKIPNTLEELVTLRGVGRKTASVVLNQAFGLPAIAVDTHVKRVSQRLGWARANDPVKIEFELRELLPMELWADVNGLLILHGRKTCKSQKPRCETCSIAVHCEYRRKSPQSPPNREVGKRPKRR